MGDILTLILFAIAAISLLSHYNGKPKAETECNPNSPGGKAAGIVGLTITIIVVILLAIDAI